MGVSIALACGGKGCFAGHDVGVPAAAKGFVTRCILVVTNPSPDMAPSWTSRHVRFQAAIGAKADVDHAGNSTGIALTNGSHGLLPSWFRRTDARCRSCCGPVRVGSAIPFWAHRCTT